MSENFNVAFAFYHQNKLMGYRQDTVGTIGMRPKLYEFSPEQIEVCLRNIRENVKNPAIFSRILNMITSGEEVTLIANAEKDIHEQLQAKRAFEVRIEKAPDYKTHFDIKSASYVTDYLGGYPHEEVAIWLQDDYHEVLQTHFFSITGQLNLS